MKRWNKKDAGTIFNPIMYLMILLLTAQLLILFVEYKRVAWVSGTVTDSMTDALLGACTLNEEELYHYGTSDELEIMYPEEKYDIFKEILCEELGLNAGLQVTDHTIPLLEGAVQIKDFRVYSVNGENITFYDFDAAGGYSTTILIDMTGVHVVENGAVIGQTTLTDEIEFTVNFLGLPISVSKYHMVDVTN